MPDDLPLDAAGPARPPRFLLHRLLVALAALVVMAAGMLAPVEAIRTYMSMFLSVAAPAALAVAIIYGRGPVRAFAIGGMFHYWGFWVCYGGDWYEVIVPGAPKDDPLKTAAMTGVAVLFVISGGLLAVGVRWFVGDGARRAMHPDGAAVELPPQQEHRPFQFTLRSMFLVTTLVAVVCSALFATAAPVVLAAIAALAVLIPMAFTVAVVHARGYRRTFCVGAIFPSGIALLLETLICWVAPMNGGILAILGLSDPVDESQRVTIAVSAAAYLVFVFLCGLVAIGVRWMIESPRRMPHPHHVHWDLSKPHGQPAGDDGQFVVAMSEQEETEATETG